jgi:O-antigen ligase
VWIAERISIPPSTPTAVQYAAVFYLAHILCQGWIGSSEGFLALSLIAWFTALWRREIAFVSDPLLFPLALFLVASLLSALASYRPAHSLAQMSEVMTMLVFPLALSLYRRIEGLREIALRTFAVLTIFLSVWGLFQYFVLGHRELEQRITGPTAHVMTYSGIILALALLSLVAWLHDRRPYLLVATVTSSAALLLTFTRGAWLGWLAGFAMLALMRWRRWVPWIVTLLIVLVTFSSMAIFARLVSSFDLDHPSNFDRVRMVEAGAAMIHDHPLLGVGPDNVKEIYPLYRRDDAPRFKVPHLHNNVVQIWAERGILALAGYLLFVGICFVRFARVPKDDPVARNRADAGMAIVVGLATAGLFEYNFGDTEVLLNMLDVVALIVATIAATFGLRGPESGGDGLSVP